MDVSSIEAMDKVISRSEERLDGRNLLIKNAKNFEGRPTEKKQRYHVKKTHMKGERRSISGGDTRVGRLMGIRKQSA